MRLLPGLLRGLLAALFVFAAASDASADTEHTVRSGQTLSAIARRYHVPASTISRANGLGRGARLRVGQVLVIPTGESITVGRGETLASLARRHGVAVADLARVNGLR
ncbi:MAG: LysM peptidoglycan-binding domain-containing protein, partial [Candidatus Eisenbacteria bacterium]|nr:LysM peptidoglycan-binding domain-containing protein [Candidatus Eisenbacteria bacterium]